MTTKDEADVLKLTGWVRNCPDGSLEVFAQGPDEDLEKIEAWCAQGPPDAVIENIEVEDVPEQKLDRFEIRI